MSSPTYQAKSSSISGKASTRSLPRKDEVSTSNPLPSFHRTPSSPRQQYGYLEGPAYDRMDETWPRLNVPALAHSRSGSHLQTMDVSHNRLSSGPSIVMSSMSSMPSLKQGSKKSSVFKATIKRMFGSKRQRTSTDDARKEYHMSDPGNLMGTANPPRRPPSTRQSSRPRTAMQRSALGSHAVSQKSDVHDTQPSNTDPFSTASKRRNTLPSLVFSEHEAQSFSKRLGEFIGNNSEQAVRSNEATYNNDKRRSKSAEALVEISPDNGQDATIRRDRDSEIAFWRSSILLNQLSKSSAHTQENPPREEPEPYVKETPSLEQIIQPQQSFDFGLGTSVYEPADLEERVNTLEVKMFDLEYAIAKLQGVELPKPALPTRRMKRKNVQEVFSKPSMQSLSTATSGYERRPITPMDSPVMSSSFKETNVPDRTSKATTIRPYVRSDSQARSSLRLTADQFDSLMAMMQDEKDARQLMEMQIIDLQKEIELLHSPVYATINYPSAGSESTSRATTQKKLHRSPPFRFNKPPVRETSRFSMTESDTDSLDNETYTTPRQRNFEFDKNKSSPLIGVIS